MLMPGTDIYEKRETRIIKRVRGRRSEGGSKEARMGVRWVRNTCLEGERDAKLKKKVGSKSWACGANA